MAVYTTIDDPSAYFKVQLYTGNATNDTAIVFNDTDTDMQPDMVWIKCRDAAENHSLSDVIQGDATGRDGLAVLHPNTTQAEDNGAGNLYVESLDSDGFTIGANDQVNVNTKLHTSWSWKAGTTSGLSGGTITPSAYSINTTSGFGMYGYAGNSTAGATITHGLGAKPGWISCKRLNDTGGWTTYNSGAGATKFAYLDLTDIFDSGSTEWNDTEPTTSVFSLGTHGTVNNSAGTYIAYVWADVQGFSKFGSYEGNGNADGSFIYTGFKPAWVMCKSIDSTSSWHIFDNKREGFNPDNDTLVAEATTVEPTTDMIDLLSNGFKFRISTDPNVAESYIYMAFAESPFVNSEGVPCNAR